MYWIGSILALVFGYIGMLVLVLLFGDLTFTTGGDSSPSDVRPLFQ